MKHYLIALFAIGMGVCHADETPPFGVTLIPYGTTFKSFSDYSQVVLVDSAKAKGKKVTSAEMEIRFSQEKLRLIRFPYPWDLGEGIVDQRKISFPKTYNPKLEEPLLRRLGTVQAGEYQLALYLNGIRASNVISIQIDPQFDPVKAPALQLGTIEPDPLASYAQLIVWARGPFPFDPEFRNYTIYATPLKIDGVDRQMQPVAWSGPVGPLESGLIWWFMPDFKYYKPPIDFHQPHTVDFKFGKYTASQFHFDPFEKKLNVAWDAMTSEIKDAPSLPIALEGKVIDSGKGAPAYRVDLIGPTGQHEYWEYTDPKGIFQFAGIAAGIYTIGCSSVSHQNFSDVSPKTVTVSTDGTQHVDLRFRTK